MNRETFKELTGEDPEDIFGGDWENDLDHVQEDDDDIDDIDDGKEELDGDDDGSGVDYRGL
jgi:hypothetical protein